MKQCISRLIKCISHLWQTLQSTFVEKWLLRHATDIYPTQKQCHNPDGTWTVCNCKQCTEFVIETDAGNILVLNRKGGRTDEGSESSY